MSSSRSRLSVKLTHRLTGLIDLREARADCITERIFDEGPAADRIQGTEESLDDL